MLGKWQFSLRYLLLEIFLVCAAIGLFRAALELPEGYDAHSLVLIIASLAFGGAAVGGLYGRMIHGLLWAIILAIIAALFAPAVMYS